MCADGHKKRLFMRRYASALGRLSEWTVSGICAIIPSMHYRMAVAASGFSGRSNGEYVMYALVKLVRRFTSDRQAVTAVEYGLIAAIMAAVILGVLATLNTGLGGAMTHVGNTLTSTTAPAP